MGVKNVDVQANDSSSEDLLMATTRAFPFFLQFASAVADRNAMKHDFKQQKTKLHLPLLMNLRWMWAELL